MLRPYCYHPRCMAFSSPLVARRSSLFSGTIPPMRKLTPAILWLIFIYLITALAEDLPPPPDGFWARVFDESKHVVAHGGVYGVQALLIVAAVGYPGMGWRAWQPVLILILVLGLGQEALQILMRHRFQPIGSPFDLLVDASGASLALWLYPRMMRWPTFRSLFSRLNPLPTD
jgi:hypothetical protein